jgi:hypothetical protein
MLKIGSKIRKWTTEFKPKAPDMKRYLVFFTCLFIIASTSGCVVARPARSSGDQPYATVGALLEAWVKLWNTYDLSMVDELFVRNSSLTYFSSEKEGVVRGIEAVREHHREFEFVEGGQATENLLWLEDLATDVFDGFAIVTALWYFRRGSGEDAVVQRGPVTFVCARRTGRWRLVHVHFANYPDGLNGASGLQ